MSPIIHPRTLSVAVLQIAMPTANAQLSHILPTAMMTQPPPIAVQEDTLSVWLPVNVHCHRFREFLNSNPFSIFLMVLLYTTLPGTSQTEPERGQPTKRIPLRPRRYHGQIGHRRVLFHKALQTATLLDTSQNRHQ